VTALGRRSRVAVAAWLGVAVRVAAEPVLRVDATDHDFGTVEDLTAHHRFTLANRGDEPLRISGLVADCEACVRWRLERYALGTNESAALDVFLDTGALEGAFEKVLRIQRAGVTSPVVALTLTGVAAPFYRLSPTALRLVASRTNEVVGGSVRIERLRETAGALRRVECDLACLRVSLAEDDARGGTRLDVRTAPPLPEGLSETVVRVTSGVPGDPVCRVRVGLYAVPDIEILPSPLVWDATDEPQSRIVFIRPRHSVALGVVDAAGPQADIQCRIVPERGTPNYRIHVSASGLGGRRGELGDLRVATVGARQELRIPMVVR
jgi:hypothetical protein